MSIIIEKGDFSWKGMDIDQVTTFFNDDGSVEAEYFYYKNQCNYLLSYGFSSGSLGDSRKKSATRKKEPFFSLRNGWHGYK